MGTRGRTNARLENIITCKVDLQIPYNICNEVQASNHIWKIEKENRGDYKRYVPLEGIGVA